MKNLLLLFTFSLVFFTFSKAQEYADLLITEPSQGTGTFTNAVLSNFSWEVIGAINSVELRDDEVFDDGSEFENIFGQADYAENIRIQNYPNGDGMAGYPVISISQLTLNFDEITPSDSWGFCLVDIDVEQCLITAIDEYDNEVSVEAIDNWLIELFDANTVEFGINIPKWDPTHAAILGSDTPEDYLVYNNLVIGGLDDSEAAAAFFMPDMPLKSLSITYENLQETYFVSYHFYVASLFPTAIAEIEEATMAIYPNPASTFVHINLAYSPVKQHTSPNLILYNLLGKIVSQTALVEDKLTLDVSHLAAGVYYVKAIVDGQSVTKKLIIK